MSDGHGTGDVRCVRSVQQEATMSRACAYLAARANRRWTLEWSPQKGDTGCTRPGTQIRCARCRCQQGMECRRWSWLPPLCSGCTSLLGTVSQHPAGTQTPAGTVYPVRSCCVAGTVHHRRSDHCRTRWRDLGCPRTCPGGSPGRSHCHCRTGPEDTPPRWSSVKRGRRCSTPQQQ